MHATVSLVAYIDTLPITFIRFPPFSLFVLAAIFQVNLG